MTLYLNHAGTSWPKPPEVRSAVADALASSPDEWPATFEAHHGAVADAFGVDPKRLLLTPGCTSALAVAIADQPWVEGDRIVTSAWEHHALHRPVLALTKRGVEHVVVPPDGDAPFDLARLEVVLREGRVRMVALGAAVNVTGAILPILEVARLARAHGALVLVDGAQVAGWTTLDLDVFDLFAFAGHKGPQAPWGIGGLYVAPHVAMTSPTASCSIEGCDAMPGYCDVGSVDRLALAGLAAGLAWCASRPDRLERARRIVERIADGARALAGVTLHAASQPRMPTLAMSFADHTPDAVARSLRAEGIIVSAGTQCAPLAHRTLQTPDGVLRLSVGVATPDDAPDVVLDALGRALDRRGDR